MLDSATKKDTVEAWQSTPLKTHFAKGIAVPVTVAFVILILCIATAILINISKAKSYEIEDFLIEDPAFLNTNHSVNEAANGEAEDAEGLQTNDPQVSLFVHVVGEVQEPGVVALVAGDRILDAIEKAGGPTAEALLEGVNLARQVNDGEQIYVPNVAEENVQVVGSNEQGSHSGLVNINQADSQQLETLPGIGPKMAEKIISWRTENGAFSSIEDLMLVSGIGPKVFADLADKIVL